MARRDAWALLTTGTGPNAGIHKFNDVSQQPSQVPKKARSPVLPSDVLPMWAPLVLTSPAADQGPSALVPDGSLSAPDRVGQVPLPSWHQWAHKSFVKTDSACQVRKTDSIRVALNFYGSVRVFKNTFHSLKNNLVIPLRQKAAIDVFAHAMLTETIRGGGGMGNNGAGEDGTVPLNGDDYKMLLPACDVLAENQTLVDAREDIAAKTLAIQPDFMHWYSNYTLANLLRSRYSIESVRNLTRRYEQRAGFKYTHVILARPDVRYELPITWDPRQVVAWEQHVWVPNYDMWGGLCDRFAAGTADAMLNIVMRQWTSQVQANSLVHRFEPSGAWVLDTVTQLNLREERTNESTARCPVGKRNAAEEECLAAAKLAATDAQWEIGERVKQVDTRDVPPGCSYSLNSKMALWNVNPHGQPHTASDYRLVCSVLSRREIVVAPTNSEKAFCRQLRSDKTVKVSVVPVCIVRVRSNGMIALTDRQPENKTVEVPQCVADQYDKFTSDLTRPCPGLTYGQDANQPIWRTISDSSPVSGTRELS